MVLFAWPVRPIPNRLLARSFSSSPHLRNSPNPKSSNDPLPVEQGSHPPNKDTLPPLSRPLGVRERPTTIIKSTTDRLKELMDTDVRMAQRRHLFVT